MDAHKHARLVDRVGSRRGFIICNGNRGRAWRTERYACGVAEGDAEVLGSFGVRIVDDWNQNRLGSFTGREPQSPQGHLVIATRGSLPGDLATLVQAGSIAGRVVHVGCAGSTSGACHGHCPAPNALRSGIGSRAELHRRRWRRSWRGCWRRCCRRH